MCQCQHQPLTFAVNAPGTNINLFTVPLVCHKYSMSILCQHGCGQPATHTTKGSLGSGPFKGAPVHQCAKSANSCPAVKERKKATSRAKYGTDYPWQSPEIREKVELAVIAKYGAKSSLSSPEVQAKRRATMLERYGVEEPGLHPELRQKMNQQIKNAYKQDPTITERIIKTRAERYGSDYKSIVNKTKKTQIANGRWVDPSLKPRWQQYKELVRKLTAKNYKRYKHIINPTNLQVGTCEWTIDHIYSVRHGFENNVPAEVIASVPNLRMLWHIENKQKHIRSDHSLEFLYEEWAKFNT